MINLNTVRSALNLELTKDDRLIDFSTDTRKFQYESIFLAITGEKYNAVDFASSVLEKNCLIYIYTESEYNNKIINELRYRYSNTEFVCVENSITALQKISSLHLEKWKNCGGKLFVVSGSNGKTTNKEMISYILEYLYPNKVIKTLKNNNNHIGVPLTILDATFNHKFLILELGSNHPGEMKVLCDICKPEMGFVTNIGETHLEFFSNLENVFQEETVCFDYIKNCNTGFFIKNNFDEYLSKLNSENTISIGKNKSDYNISIDFNFSLIEYKNEKIKIENKYITGKHNFFNLSACVIIASLLTDKYLAQVAKIASGFQPRDNRSQWIDIGVTKVFLDAYNANPSSMIAALDGFRNYVNDVEQSLIVIGDMNELGQTAEMGHKKVAKHLEDIGFKNIVYIGRYFDYFRSATNTAIEHYNDTKSYCDKFVNIDLKKYKFVFLKASRSLQLEQLVDIK